MSSRQQQQQEEEDEDDDDTLGEEEAERSIKAPEKKKRIIYFSSGETLIEEDSDEEEEDEEEPEEKASLRRAAMLIGRASLLTVDFLGQRLSSALGLNAAKYQYVLDQYHQNHHMKRRKSTEKLSDGQETVLISTGTRPSHYGSTGSTGSTGAQENHNHQHVDRMEGNHNRGYEPEDDVCK